MAFGQGPKWGVPAASAPSASGLDGSSIVPAEPAPAERPPAEEFRASDIREILADFSRSMASVRNDGARYAYVRLVAQQLELAGDDGSYPFDTVSELAVYGYGLNADEVQAVLARGVEDAQAVMPGEAPDMSNAGGKAAAVSGNGVVQVDGVLRETPRPEPKRTGEQQIKLWWHGDETTDLNRTWRVDNLLPEVGVALISGQWGLHKSFIAIDLGLALMVGDTFAGRQVNGRCGVLFIAAEGANEIPLRLQCALEDKFPDRAKTLLPFALASECPRLLDAQTLRTLEMIAKAATADMQTKHGLKLGLVVVDTMAAAAGFKDENDNAEAQRAMNVLNQLARKLGCLVVPVDHFGKDVGTGTRGASAKEASADTILAVLGNREPSGKVTNQRMVVRKVRGAASGNEIPFTLRLVDAEDGETTLVVDWQAEQGATAPPKEGGPFAQRMFLDALVEALEDGTMQPVRGSGPMVLAVDLEAVRPEFYRRYPAEGETNEKRQDAQRKAFRRGLGYALKRKLVGTEVVGPTTWVWLIKTDAG